MQAMHITNIKFGVKIKFKFYNKGIKKVIYLFYTYNYVPEIR